MRATGSATDPNVRELVAFRTARQDFCVDILSVREIRGWSRPALLPHAPHYVQGVINLRGAVVPVVDLSARFGRGGCQITRRTCIVIIEIGGGEGERHDIGVIVDAVCEVQDIPANRIEAPPAFGANIRTDFISGMGKVGEQFVIILSVNHVLSLDELAALGALHGSLQDNREGETLAA